VIAPQHPVPFVPSTVLFMEQDRLVPIRERLRVVLPGMDDPTGVLLNVRDRAYDKWESCGFPAEADDPGYDECAREYSQLCRTLADRMAYLSMHPSYWRRRRAHSPFMSEAVPSN
jgi:hypothetical protein